MTQRIVVGVDDSSGAKLALRWARAEAALRGATLDIVHAYQYPVTLAVPGAPLVPREDFDKAARHALDAVLRSEGFDEGYATAEAIVSSGSAAGLLIEVARGADLLVVGSRGRGGFAGLLLGSVSQHCVHHAPCPVVVVRGPAQD